jgi:mRNA-degrading endonuclease RelE of RelBE toxin-antitoxin system
MKTAFNPTFVQDVKKTKDKVIRKRLAAVINALEVAESLDEIPNVKKLEGYSDLYRIRIGQYRLGLCFDEGEIELLRFLHRKDIYRHFP